MSTMFKRGLALALALVMCLGLVVTGNAVEASPRASYTYTKVTEAPADWSGQYLIVCENKSVALDGGQATLGAPIDVTISDGVITGDYSASIVEIKAMEGGYSIQAANGFYFSGNKAEGLVLSEEPVLNKITIDTTKTEIAGGVGTSLRYAGTKFDYVSGYMIYSAATITLYKANEDVTIGEAEAPEQPKLVLGENAINVPAGMEGITLTFTAPEEGIYVIRPAEGETNAWVNFYFESGITMPYEFSVGEGEEVEFNISASDMTADEINLIIEKKTAPKLELGINTFEIPAYGEVVAEFTAPEAGEYTIGAAEGTNNLTVYIEGDNGSEMVELPYTFTAAEGQVVKFILGADPWDAAATVKAEIAKAGAEEPKPEVPTTYEWVKVTEALTDWSGKYLIVKELDGSTDIFDGSRDVLDSSAGNSNAIQVAMVDGKIVGDYNANCFVIAAVEGGYSIQSAGGIYIGRNGTALVKNDIDESATEAFVNTIEGIDEFGVIIKGTSGNRLGYNTNSGKGWFRYFKSTITATGAIQGVTLYKLVEAGAEPEQPEVPTSATITFDTTDKRTEFSADKQVWVENGITVTNDKASSTNNVADYDNPARFYAGSKLTIAYPGMRAITLDLNSGKPASGLINSLTGVEGITVIEDGYVITIVLDEAADSFVIESLAGQIRVNSITVSTEAPEVGGEEEKPEPVLSTIADALAATSGDFTVEGQILFIDGKNLYIKDETGAIVVRMNSNPDASWVIGGMIKVTGPRGDYNGLPQLNGCDNAAAVFTATNEQPTPISGDVSIIKDENLCQLISVTGEFTVEAVDGSKVTLKDAEGNTIVLYKAKETLAVGDKVTAVVGALSTYNGLQVLPSSVTFTAGEGSGEEEQPEDPEANSELTIPEAVELGESKAHDTFTENKYYITGIVAEIKSDVWGNMYIKDEAGNQIYIYGLYNEDGSVRYDEMEKKPAVGDTIKVYGVVGQYNGNAQIKNAWLVVEESAPTGDNSAIFFMMALMAVSMAAVVVLGKKAVR